ncbi:hypothetical protein D3C80_1485520 [compost metagenome]
MVGNGIGFNSGRIASYQYSESGSRFIQHCFNEWGRVCFKYYFRKLNGSGSANSSGDYSKFTCFVCGKYHYFDIVLFLGEYLV